MLKKRFSLVIPVYQNGENLDDTIPRCLNFFETIETKYDVELIMVNDGSWDNSLEILKKYQKNHPNILKVINFTKNFGQVMSTTAGIQYAKGDVVGVISADLQDPVELFGDMLIDWEKGKKLIIGERERRSDGIISDFLSNTYYSLLNNYAVKDFPSGGFDFWLMDRNVVDEFLKITEKNSNMMINIFNLGYDYSIHQYTREKRTKGKSQYSFWKRLESFYSSILANSYAPIRAVSAIGLISSLFGFLYAVYIVLIWLTADNSAGPKGWPTVVVLISVFSGFILMALGTIGEYIWRIYAEIRTTPRYVIEEILDDSPNSSKDQIE